jgi:riboflavin kinase/FMN adenylyltransferase
MLLGRPFEIAGPVVKGDQRGRELGFPTANLELGSYIQPAFGGYVVRAGLEVEGETRWIDAVANIGNRPTLDGTRILLETHLFEFNEDIYGRHLRVALIEFLRPEQKFDGIEALKERIEIDSAIARRMLKIRSTGAP